jgi:hypothetical protein
MRNGSAYLKTVEGGVVGGWIQFADRPWVDAKQIFAGAGLTGGGTFAADRTVSMGTPSTLSKSTTNSASGTTHTHAITTYDLIAGTNVTFTGSGANQVLGNDITINVGSVPWSSGVSSKPTTIAGFGINDAYTKTQIDASFLTKENVFSKGDLVPGANVTLSGTLADRLVGDGNVTVAVNSFPWASLTGKPTNLAGYGLDGEVYTKSQVDFLDSGKANVSHSHTTAAIINFTNEVRGQFSAGNSISISNGVISYTGGTGLAGSGFNSAVAVWGGGNTLTGSTLLMASDGVVQVNGNLTVTGFIVLPQYGPPNTTYTDGTMYLSNTGTRLYVHAGGEWKFALLQSV